MVEIQQNSDTTFRIFDWNRVGLDGKPRQLHIEEGLAVIDFSSMLNEKSKPIITPQAGAIRENFISCDKFCFDKISQIDKTTLLNTHNKTFHIITAITSGVKVICEDGSVQLKKWQTCLVPASVKEYSIEANPQATLLLFYMK